MRESGTVAALLPGAFYFSNETRKPPVEAAAQVTGADGGGDLISTPACQPLRQPASGDEHGLRPVWPDAGGGVGRG